MHTVLHGDCLDHLRTLPDASVHAIVTDPPYGLSDLKPAVVTAAITAWASGDREHVPDSRGFMGRAWDAFVPPPAVWDECLRVLKPGGHMLVFAGTRTVDLMGLSIRLAGFEIRDTITWHYGSGFPKGIDVSKAIDKAAGAEREVIGGRRKLDSYGPAAGNTVYGSGPDHGHVQAITAPATDSARQFDGWNTSLKPASEPIIVARRPLSGTVAATVLEHGTGALNIGACRVESDGSHKRPFQPTNNGREVYGAQTGFQPTNAAGRWPSNVVFSHSASCSDAGCQDGCPVAELDAQSGTSTSRRAVLTSKPGGIYGGGAGLPSHTGEYGHNDSGGASRFFATFRHAASDQGSPADSFPTFKYQAKAPTRERPKVDGVAHSTVKPLTLMRWLTRLVCPPGGTVLEPFAGSGTTVEAAILEGFNVIGIEREAEYLPLIHHRIDRATEQLAEVPEPEVGLFDLDIA